MRRIKQALVAGNYCSPKISCDLTEIENATSDLFLLVYNIALTRWWKLLADGVMGLV